MWGSRVGRGDRALVPAVLAARPDGLGRRRSAWSLPLRLVRPPGLGHRLFQRPGARAGYRAWGLSPRTPRTHWRAARRARSQLGTHKPAFLQQPRLGLFTTQTCNLHILMPPVISPSELRCHKTRWAGQRDPPPQPPQGTRSSRSSLRCYK